MKNKQKTSLKQKIKLIGRNIKYFIPLLIKVNPLIIFSLIFTAVFRAITNLIWVIFPKMIIEELCNERREDYLIKVVLIFVLLVFILRALISNMNSIQYYFTRRADFKIDDMFNKKISSIDYFHIEDPKFADELSYAKKCLNDYSNGIYSLTWTLSNIIENVITIIGVISIVVYSNEVFIILISVVGIFISSAIYGKFQNIEEEYNKAYVRNHRIQWYFNSSMMNFRNQKNLRLYNAEELIKNHANKVNDEMFKGQKKTSRKMMILEPINSTYQYIFTTFLVIVILLYSVYYKNSSIAIFTMLYSAVNNLNYSVEGLVYSLKSYYKDCTYQDNYINLMEIKSVFKDGKTKIKEIETIEFKNVSFKYPRTDNYILKDINFKIYGKEKTSLVGLNGAGKTTLIKLLCRFFIVEEGQILINGIDINDLVYDNYMKKLSVVFQDFKIISFNIKSNVANDDDNQEKLYDVFKRVQILDKVVSLPNKEFTYVNKWFDKTGVEFSGGEMQKFALARSLYKDSDLIILDEPTSALDPMAEAEIYYRFKDVVGEKLTIFISHRLSSCIFSNHILVLDGSKIVESGTHQELMANENGLYAKMFKAQAKYYQE